MGKLDMKLMQGIEETEKQIQSDKQIQKQNTVFVGSQNPEKASKQSKAGNDIKKSKKSENEPNTKPQKQVFSFRAMIADIAFWKAYSTASGKTMENIGTAAMHEYMKRHKLNGAEQAVFEALMVRERSRERGGRGFIDE